MIGGLIGVGDFGVRTGNHWGICMSLRWHRLKSCQGISLNRRIAHQPKLDRRHSG